MTVIDQTETGTDTYSRHLDEAAYWTSELVAAAGRTQQPDVEWSSDSAADLLDVALSALRAAVDCIDRIQASWILNQTNNQKDN